MKEQWKQVFNSHYFVSNLGRIKRFNNGELVEINPKLGTRNYLRVNIKGKEYKIHVLVATLFLKKPKGNNLVVDHLDRNKLNNRVDNLEWVTQSVNIKRHYERMNTDKIMREMMEQNLKSLTIIDEMTYNRFNELNKEFTKF
jgi:hypothetical protein